MKPINYVILASLLTINLAHAASFDCAKASTRVEKTICQSSILSKLDERLAKQYKKEAAISPSFAKDEQLKWLKYQRNTCKTEACIGQAYQRRLNEQITYTPNIEKMKNMTPPKDAYGNFHQMYQVSMIATNSSEGAVSSVDIHPIPSKPQIAILDAQLVFANYHVCTLEEATMYWHENHWSFGVMRNNDGMECDLRVYPNDGNILLEDKNNRCKQDLCGARGYFDGIILPRKGNVD